ncbi:MAG: NAD(P)/FAD-dependent oxidoreductase [Methanomicrobiales archaeon]|nr:NAD(P)/FAD-dependent oxidoreductase [Methanomicrobiales archaeon]
MNVCVIGGGLTGLSAAYRLGDGTAIDLYEKAPVLGGCCASYGTGDVQIEQFYHHCFSGDAMLLALLEELGLEQRLAWRTGTTGSYAGGTVHPLSTPLDILRYPPLGLVDIARIALVTLRSRRLDREALDQVPARDFLLETVGASAYRSFFEPLLKSKFGDRRGDVSAAWLVSRIAIRSDRGSAGERLGYIEGGFHHLIDALARRCADNGCRIMTGKPAETLQRTATGWEVNGTPYDAVIATVGPSALAALGEDRLSRIPYQGAACMTLALDRDVLGGTYWINMAEEAPYGAVIGHTNFIPRDRYGEDIVYLASYFQDSLHPDAGERMLADFCRRFSVGRDEIRWHRLAVEPEAGPVYTTGYRRTIPAYRNDGLYLAGMFSLPNYPERSMEGSIAAGTAVAACVREDLAA